MMKFCFLGRVIRYLIILLLTSKNINISQIQILGNYDFITTQNEYQCWLISYIIAKYMSQQSIKTNQQLDKLLIFQDNFISLVHTNVYHKTDLLSELIFKFEINHISQLNEDYNVMVSELTDQLITKKLHYEMSLKDDFQKLLQVDYLPLLRINRYEITKLSLYGFDIYVEPLEAVLNILSRIDSIKQRIISSNISQIQNQNALAALEKGWDTYLAYADFWRLSFNLYILKEYLTIGGHSFLRKDRQILYTGISNLYNELIPTFLVQNNIKMLIQFAQLNNCLYYFHQSFNYFQLFSLMLPVKNEYEPIFYHMKEVTEKCLRTNILTPLLFGILRHRQSFLKFVASIDSEIWLPYLNVLISGIAINLKFRILQYEQIIQVFERCVERAGLLGEIRTIQISGKLEDGWRDAKEFFISAVKIGFNSGDAETWKPIEFELIGPRVINSLLNGMLLNLSQNKHNLQIYLENGVQKLDNEIKIISNNQLDLYFIKSTIYQLEKPIQCQSQVFNLIRIVNLIKVMSQQNEYSFNFIITSFLNIKCQLKEVLTRRINETVDIINQLLYKTNMQNFTFLKDKIVQFHKKYYYACKQSEIIQFYSKNYETKKYFASVMQILPIGDQFIDKFVTHLATKIISKPSSKKLKLKTFEKQYLVRSDLINPSLETHCLFSEVICRKHQNNTDQTLLTKKIVTACPWITFALLNFPLNDDGELYSFGSWLIEKQKNYDLLKFLLKVSKGVVTSEDGTDLISEFIYPSIFNQLIKKINETDNISELYSLSKLALELNTRQDQLFARDLLAVYLFLLQKTANIQQINSIVTDILQLITLAFGNKLKLWVINLLIFKIQGKIQITYVHRKRPIKSISHQIYFLNEITEAYQTQSLMYQNPQHVQAVLLNFGKTQKRQQIVYIFNNIIKEVSTQNYDGLKEHLKQNMIAFEQMNTLSIPKLEASLLVQILNQKNEVIIDFLGLKDQNFVVFVKEAILQKNIDYLSRNRFIKRLNRDIPALINLSQQIKFPVLAKMSEQLSIKERIKISEQFFVETSLLPLYCQYYEGIEYLTAFNGNNWRVIIQYFTKEFNHFKLSSILLQYHEFVIITGQKNSQYEHIILEQAELLNKFISLFLYKIQYLTEVSSSEEERSLRQANELSSLNIITSTLELKEIFAKLSILNKNFVEKGLQIEGHWIDNISRLNSKINEIYNGQVILCDFMNGYCLTNELVYYEHQTEIGVLLENYYEKVGVSNNDINDYVPKKLKILPFKDFIAEKNYQLTVVQPIKTIEIKNHYQTLIKKLVFGGIIGLQNKKVVIKQISTTLNNEICNDIYQCSCCHVLLNNQERYDLPLLIKEVLKRKRLSWDLLKIIDLQQFNYISTVLADSDIAAKNMNFTYKNEELVANGINIKVTQYNKESYCNKIALKAIGEPTLQFLRLFLQGYINQSNAQ